MTGDMSTESSQTELSAHNTAEFCLERLYKAASNFVYFEETGKLLRGEVNVLTPETVRIELVRALIDTRLSYYKDSPFQE